MAIKGYFFNAEIQPGGGYDRLYNNEDVCGYLDKIIGNGVFPNPSSQLQVVPSEPASMGVVINPGQAWINGHKLWNDSELYLDVSAAPNVAGYSRYDRVVFAVNHLDRVMDIYILNGNPGTEPTPPALTRNNDIYEMSLALIKVDYGDTSIAESKIYDTRGDSSVCGWVAGLIQQIDVSNIASQYVAQYEQILQNMISWEQQQKTDYDSWFASLTEDLTIGAYLLQYRKVVQGPASNVIPLDMEDYIYDRKDLIHVTLNGLLLSPGSDYRINNSASPASIIINTEITSGNTLDVLAVKSSLQPSSGGMVTSVVGDRSVYIPNALPDENIRRMWVNTLGSTNNFAISGRNLIRYDRFETHTVEGLTFTKIEGDRIRITGSSGSVYRTCYLPLDKSTFIPGQKYTVSIVSDDEIDPEDVSVGLTVNNMGYVVQFGSPATVTIPDEFNKIELRIDVEHDVDADYTIGVQLEYGPVANEFNRSYYDTYVYDGENTPKLNDEISNIWLLDENASGLKVAYFVTGTMTDGDSLLYPLENS